MSMFADNPDFFPTQRQPKLAPPVGPFSQAIRADGFIYLSGQVGQDPATGKLVEGGVLAETEQVFKSLAAVLEAAGKSFDDVVRAGVFLTSVGEFAAMNGVYAKGLQRHDCLAGWEDSNSGIRVRAMYLRCRDNFIWHGQNLPPPETIRV